MDLAVEDFDQGTIALGKAAKEAQLADARVTRSREHLADLQARYGTVAAAAYRGGNGGDFVSLVTTSSPQTFLDRASALDHISRNKREQILTLRAADRELRAASAASEVALGKQRAVANQLAKTKAGIEADVSRQQVLLKQLEVDEAKRVAAALAERKRLAALAAARAERARLAKIEAERVARLAAEKRARLQRVARALRQAKMNQLLAAQASAAEEALRQARADEQAANQAEAQAAADAASQQQQADPNPQPKPDPTPANDSSGSRASIAVRAAYAQLGKPYVWAADGPGSFDCSGLTMYVWARAGVYLPHSSRAQFGQGQRVSRSELQPGDLVFFGSPIHHVGIYVGGGEYIAAPQTGDVVSVRSMGRGDYAGAVRL